jgi:hypothetical protein
MQRRRPELSQCFKVIRGCVPFVTSKTVLRIDGVPLFHARVAVRLGQNRGRSDGHAARVAFDERFLFNHHIELHRVDQQVIRLDGQLQEGGGHGLPAGLINIPRVDSLRIDFGDSPGDGVLANARCQFGAALGRKFFRIIQANDAAPGIENDRSRDYRTEQRTAAGFVQTGDAHPAEFSRLALETGTAQASHRAWILAWQSRCRIAARKRQINRPQFSFAKLQSPWRPNSKPASLTAITHATYDWRANFCIPFA